VSLKRLLEFGDILIIARSIDSPIGAMHSPKYMPSFWLRQPKSKIPRHGKSEGISLLFVGSHPHHTKITRSYTGVCLARRMGTAYGDRYVWGQALLSKQSASTSPIGAKEWCELFHLDFRSCSIAVIARLKHNPVRWPISRFARRRFGSDS
jgi:hypothetical protein